jgi:hypothetical protein
MAPCIVDLSISVEVNDSFLLQALSPGAHWMVDDVGEGSIFFPFDGQTLLSLRSNQWRGHCGLRYTGSLTEELSSNSV